MDHDHLSELSRRKLFRLAAIGAGTLGIAGVVQGTNAEPSATATPNTPWQAFCQQLMQAGDQILRPEAPQDDRTRAEGYRYLSRLLRAALEQEVEASDLQFPVLYQLSNETIKIGADNPDNHYLNAQIDGQYDYRISGQRGTISYVSFSTKAGNYGKSGSLLPTGSIDTNTLHVEPDGSFEVILSATRKPGNWLPMSKDSSMLIVRQTFLDRDNEKPAQMNIECLNGPRYPAPLTSAGLENHLLAAASFVEGTARIFADWAARFKDNVNSFTELDQAEFQRQGGDASIFYGHGYWQLDPGQALLIDIPAVENELWNFQVNNHWMESLDYRYFTIHLNKFNTHYRADGGATLVLAHSDPGVPNWLNTSGLEAGTMMYRVVHGAENIYPKARLVPLEEVRQQVS